METRRGHILLTLLFFLGLPNFVLGDITNMLRRTDMAFEEKKEAFFKNAADIELCRGYFLIVDNIDHRILEFLINNDKLEFQRSIGGQGQGPGDLQLPIRISTWNDTLAVQDQQGISFFDLEGNFKTRFRIFAGGISFLFSNNNIYYAAVNPTKFDLIEVHSMEGQRLYSFAEKRELVDFNYNTVKGMSPTTVEMAIFNCEILSDGKYVYLLNRRFGTLTKFSTFGENVFETTITDLFGKNELSKVKENRRLFLEEGYDFLKTKTVPQHYVFRDAKLLGNSIFLLKDQWDIMEKKQNALIEIKAIDKESLELRSTYQAPLGNDEQFFSFDVIIEKDRPIFYVLLDTEEGYKISKFIPS